MADEQTFVNTQVPATLDIKLRTIAAMRQVSRSDVVRSALEKYVDDFFAFTEMPRHRETPAGQIALAIENPNVLPED